MGKLAPAGRTAPTLSPCTFGDELTYRLRTEHGDGNIRVRFAELPVSQWHSLSAEHKRERGITNARTVSALRVDREIDRGWFFMGGKTPTRAREVAASARPPASAQRHRLARRSSQRHDGTGSDEGTQ